MSGPELSRRGFLASAAGASWLAMWPAVLAAAKEAGAARDAGQGFALLTAAEAADFAAIAAQIIPSDAELPGATEAGVVHFIDQALKGFMAGAAEGMRKDLQALNAKAGGPFSTLAPARQNELLKAEEKSGFFGTVRFLTVAGMFALPSYGGNRDYAGWKLIGFEHRMAWLPPFGHYDAVATGKKP